MNSTQSGTPNNNMATSSTGDYFAIISQLMAEKDRLITEKDELVVSKDRLWREMYQMLQEKNEHTAGLPDQQKGISRTRQDQLEIQRLRGRVGDLERRNRELEQALRDALETDADCEEGCLEDDGFAMQVERPLDEILK